ncbi:hypothetical protein GCM10023223_29170 [Stackebrandtia albiflava]
MSETSHPRETRQTGRAGTGRHGVPTDGAADGPQGPDPIDRTTVPTVPDVRPVIGRSYDAIADRP